MISRHAEQAVAARRLDSVILKHLFCAQVEGCSLGAAEPQRSAAALKDMREEPHGAGERTVVTSEVERAMLHASRMQIQLVSAQGGQRKRRVTSAVPPNNRLHLTANSAALMQGLSLAKMCARQVKRGVRCSRL